MSKALGQSYILDIVLYIIGFIFLIGASQIKIAEGETDSRKMCWKITLYSLGSLLIGFAAVGNVLLHTVYEYKLLKMKV